MNDKHSSTDPKRKKYRWRWGPKLPKHLDQINHNAAGIDVGARKHYVAVPEDRDEHPVQVFEPFTPDLIEMVQWLKQCGIDTVVMESTGVYWIPLFQVLQDHGFEVLLVDARHVKYVPGRKTDVFDCQWLQQLHTFGLLRGAFVPDKDIAALRTYSRQRKQLVQSCSREIQHMQKALTQMNLQLPVVISDITGVTGMRIIRAIVAGERDPVVLAKMKHPGVKSSEETIVKALSGNYRHEHVFTLTQALDLYDIYQGKIAQCDQALARRMQAFEVKADPKELAAKPSKRNKRKRRKNEPHFDLRAELYQMTGVDLTQIDGIDAMTALSIITECGFDMQRFPTEKHFASWLGLCPNNTVTGGKVKKTRSRNVHNRAAQALRIAAQSLHSSTTYLGAHYRRMHARLGAPKALTATAHKLGRLVYHMLKYGQDYVDKGQQYEEEQYRKRAERNLRRRAHAMGYQLICVDTGEILA